jgi:hypothetical protein
MTRTDLENNGWDSLTYSYQPHEAWMLRNCVNQLKKGKREHFVLVNEDQSSEVFIRNTPQPHENPT